MDIFYIIFCVIYWIFLVIVSYNFPRVGMLLFIFFLYTEQNKWELCGKIIAIAVGIALRDIVDNINSSSEANQTK